MAQVLEHCEGKPVARRGRKVTGLFSEEAAGLRTVIELKGAPYKKVEVEDESSQ
jgi:hypothetical protein